MATDNGPSKNRKVIERWLTTIHPSGRSLDYVIEELTELRKEFGKKGWDCLRLDEDNYTVRIFGARWETDAEVAERLRRSNSPARP